MIIKHSTIPLLLALSIMLVRSPLASAREEHGGGGGGHPAAPHAEAPHMAAPHMEAPHMAAPHMAAPHMAAPHMAAPHAAPHMAAPHAAPHMAAPHAAPHMASPHEHAPSQPHESAKHEEAKHESGHDNKAESAHEAGHENKAEAAHEGAKQHESAESKHGEEKAHEKDGSNAEHADKASHEEQKGGKEKDAAHEGHDGKEASGGKPAEEGGKHANGAVAPHDSFANPRKTPGVKPGSKPQMSSAKPGRLSYRNGAHNVPHAGPVGKGKAGIFDPGGYVRSARNGAARIDRNRIQQQLSSIPNYEKNFGNNNRGRIEDRNRWPNHWNPGAGVSGLGYYPGYSWNGTNYPFNYFALNGFCPTPYLFLLESGAFWQPGVGYGDYLPYGYNQPITISINEVVPQYDAYGHIIGYQNQVFYYNASWDPNAQAYGYYDYRGGFHWVTYPWLNSWGGA